MNSDNHVSFEIELLLDKKDREAIEQNHGLVWPKIPTWFIETKGGSSSLHGSTVIFKGPKEDVEVMKAIVEEYYDGCKWRYGRNE